MLHISSKALVCVSSASVRNSHQMISEHKEKEIFSTLQFWLELNSFSVNFIKFRPRHTSGKKNCSSVTEI